MSSDEFTREVESLRTNFADLLARSEASSGNERAILQEAIEELSTVMEELNVAGEELSVQTEELLATRDLVEAERQRYRDLFEFAPDGYLVTDSNGVIREANLAAASLLNVRANYLVGKPLSLYLTAGQREPFRRELLRIQETGHLDEWITQICPREREPIDASVVASVIERHDDHGAVLRWLVRDVSERRQAERQIRQLNVELEQRVAERTAELEAANAIKSELLRREQAALAEARDAIRVRDEFLSIASHELKTPLTTIKASAQLIERQLQRPEINRPHLLELVGSLNHQVRRFEELISDLLDVSRIRMGHLDLRYERFDLVELATQVVDRFQSEVESNPEHRLALHAEGPVVGEWDRGRLDQLLTNLLSNALKYSPAGGEIDVRVRQLDDQAELSVRDEGIGISDEAQADLFKPFMRLDATHYGVGGSGLGLYISARIVEHHGGNLTVESAVGKGSTFTARLPLTSPGAE